MAAARRAAEAAGISLQEWLSRTILENARRSGIVPEDPSRQVAGQAGQASAEEAVQAIARHLERAKSAADHQGLSLADWLSRAILTNAGASENQPSRRSRMPPPPSPDLASVLRGDPHRPRAELPVTPPRFHSRRPQHNQPPASALPDARSLPDVLSRNGEGDAPMPPPGAEMPRRRRSGPLWAMLVILVLIAGGIWALQIVNRPAGQRVAAASIAAPAKTGDAETKAAKATGKSPAQAPEKGKLAAALPPGATPQEKQKSAPMPGKPMEKAEARPVPPAAGPGTKREESASGTATPGANKAPAKQAAGQPPAEKAPPPKSAEKPLPESGDGDLARVPVKDMPKPAGAHVDWYKKAADAGNPNAQYALAELYLKGDGVTRNFQTAAALFRRAADRGNLARAQYALGLMCQRGLGVPKSDVEAVLWWQKAADQNFMPAVTWVGLSLLNGKGIQKDVEAARKMLERAADGDEPNAQYTLGRIYEEGVGVKKDLVVAMKWFILAAEQAHPQATQKVEELSTTLPRDQQERATELVSEHYRRFRKRS
jgi:hypothetical protein